MNSCRDGNGNVDEPNCGPLQTPPGWQSYEGVASQLGCCSAFCLCTGPFFYITLTKLYNDSSVFCNYLPSVNGSDDSEWDRILGVAGDYCTREGYPPNLYLYTVEGPTNSTGKLSKPGSGMLNS